MKRDAEGFLYPEVNTEMCSNCRMCDRVCPVLNASSERKPLRALAVVNADDEVRRLSSSGGAFSLLAEKVISQGGAVCGARWNSSLDVEHTLVTTVQELAALRGSKYVQSSAAHTLGRVRDYLREGRRVMFVGTPCQVMALRRFLGSQDPDNLLTVDFICHGTASPAVWHYYIDQCERQMSRKQHDGMKVTSVSMRDKRNGWKNYQVTLRYESADGSRHCEESCHSSDNPFIRAHGSNLILRPSCAQCPAKSGRSMSDITMADFWGIEKVVPPMDDDRGTSLLLINTGKGNGFVSDIAGTEVEVSEALASNRSWAMPSAPHPKREQFMRGYRTARSFRWYVIRFVPYTIRGLLRKLRRDLTSK